MVLVVLIVSGGEEVDPVSLMKLSLFRELRMGRVELALRLLGIVLLPIIVQCQ